MSDWQQRVIEERASLFEKLKKLNAFLCDGEKTMKISAQENVRLSMQAHTMNLYVWILDERIAAFK